VLKCSFVLRIKFSADRKFSAPKSATAPSAKTLWASLEKKEKCDMKLFTIDNNGKFVQFEEREFKVENKEIDLEILLENNPEYFFDNSKILVIGRQVTTNLNTFIDLLGVDQYGNTVVIELKRGKTPRETLSQLIEYASFIDNLDYEQLNEIYQNYSGEDSSLEDYHQEYYKSEVEEKVSWNKSSKLVIVASTITPEIKQTTMYLRKKGLDIYCLEFKYFINKAGNKMISSDFVVGDEEYIRTKIGSSAQLPKTDKEKFVTSLDKTGKFVFETLLKFAEEEKLTFRWGSKGFSLNKPFKNSFVGLCYGYPPNSVYKQSIYTGFEEIRKKVNNPDTIVDYYKSELERFGNFEQAKSNLKWVLNKEITTTEINKYLVILKQVIEKIEKEGLKND
jgi:translation initiation factor 2 beta subunit (eIF-2beta)/eIF-5